MKTGRSLMPALLVTLVGTSTFCTSLQAQEPEKPASVAPRQREVSQYTLRVGESLVLRFADITRAAVGDPAVADVVVLTTEEVLLNGKAPGTTQVYVWDRRGQSVMRVNVEEAPSRLTPVMGKLNAQIANPTIVAREVNGSIFLEGRVATEYESKRAESIASAYSKDVRNLIQVTPPPPEPPAALETIQRALPKGLSLRALSAICYVLEGTATPAQQERTHKLVAALGKDVQVIDLVGPPVGPPRQILVRAKIVDVDRNAKEQLGVEWGPLLSGVGRLTVGPQPFIFGETRPGPFSLEDGGPIRRLDPVGVQLRALVDTNRARILSEPNLLVMEGEKGKILVGGEVPIPVIQSVGGVAGAAITIQYKQVGVSLDIEGTIADDGEHIQLHVLPEVSAIDEANTVITKDLVIPGFSTRRSETWLYIRNGQTLVIGGLFQESEAKSMRKIPLLGDIPVLGELFKTRQRVKRQTELMIFVTPEIVTPQAASSSPAAGASQSAQESAK